MFSTSIIYQYVLWTIYGSNLYGVPRRNATYLVLDAPKNLFSREKNAETEMKNHVPGPGWHVSDIEHLPICFVSIFQVQSVFGSQALLGGIRVQ